MARVHYENKELNIDLVVHFISNNVVEKFGDHSSWENLKEMALNTSELKYNNTVSVYYQETPYLLATSMAILFVIIGLVGLIIKLRNKNFTNAVKVIRCSISVWITLVGVVMTVSEGAYFQASSQTPDMASFFVVLAAGLSCVLRVAVIAYKMFTVIIYSFQNVMIYRPFYFRQHKTGFAKWLVRSTLGQWVVTTLGYLSACLVLVCYRPGQDDCEQVLHRAHIWKISITFSTYLGFLGSMLLSLVFVVGYYNKAGVNAEGSRQAETRRTLLCCSVEILFDISVLLYIGLAADNCLTTNLSEGWYSGTDCVMMGYRLQSLEMGVAKCGVQVLCIQPLFQEIASLVFDLVNWLYPL